jgi:capsular exopolysaccharide synthesis family protein
MCIALVVCFFYLRYASDVYQSSAKIKIVDNSNTAFKLPTDNISIFGNNEINKANEIVIMKSSRIIGAVVDRLNLTTEIYRIGRIKSNELWKNVPFSVIWAKDTDSLKTKQASFQIILTKNGYKLKEKDQEFKFGQTNFSASIPFKIITKNKAALNNANNKEYQITLKTRKSVIQSLSNAIAIDYVVKESDILSLTLNGFNRDKISDIINTLIEVFNQDGIEDRQLVSKKTIEFVDQRFKYLFNELDDIETSKANFKKERGFSYIESDAGVFMRNSYESKSKLLFSNTQIALAKLMMDALNTSKELELLPSNIGIENNEVNGLVANYNEQILKRNKLLLSGGGELNPMIQEISSLALQIKNNLRASIIGYQKVLEFNRNEASKISEVEQGIYNTVPLNEKGMHSIQRQQSVKESLYILLLQKREEAAINLAITNPSVKVVDYAIFTTKPISPERNVLFLTALLIGLLVPIAIIFIYYSLDNKINSKEDVESLLPDVPIIAEVPFIETTSKIIRFMDRSILSESFRILRNNINYINPKTDKASVLFVTSTIKGEGKTFVSLNLAITLATLGKKVILLGADLRNPQLHRILDLERPSLKGITNYLYDTSVNVNDIISKHVSDTNIDLDIIFSGNIPPNPAELLSNGRFELLLNQIKNDYDYIIVDTAPTLLVADTTLITHLADTVLYVTRANFTEKKLLKFISNLKTLNTIKNMGIILNNVGQNKGYGYSYSYNYGYGYGYDNDNPNAKISLRRRIKKWYKKVVKK